ncbi:GPI mannosyltransferase [Penicillium macrosclerotiorum]|uniref:GPI mannosyltransferase n=1 Tax=Penicillium macrosclerotiorum TaxID=303699 RepID=UPI002548303B|nr:GPI mannosyltransferase [Penicillium macrosclerotiorum]KAJ5675974.1 GPI mannosyltransferase [Penicillium macrosclerotiorum]
MPSSTTSSSSASSSVRRAPSPPSPATSIFLFLVAFRLLNAFAVRTFFQPDEYFQSLEPAWQIAFGKGQGAWVTWEWHHQLRSSLHPLFFAAIYKAADLLASALRLSDATRAEILIAGPKTAQAVIAATGDLYTWKLATRVYGSDSRGAWTALIATILNPWQWFCSTRTLSNCLETTLTIVALDLWPWKWSAGTLADDSRQKNAGRQRGSSESVRLLSNLRQCLSLAALACILRPTNILIWATLASVAWLRTSWTQRQVLVREVLLCGLSVLAVSAAADRLFYGIWTFPPLRFLYFNIAQSLAVFYGRNDWHYYLSQGYPLLLTTLLPFALWGLYRTLTIRTFSASDKVQTAIRVQLATVCLLMPFVLSLISHKEVRFIYPLLPSLHILAAPPLVQFFYPALYSRSSNAYTPQRLVLIFCILVNLVIALYTTLYHASGVLNVLTYLRRQHEIHTTSASVIDTKPQTGITAGFLMPCHSTPWRSHLIYPTINAWALSCEPPIDLTAAEKAVYRDEADQFYDDPAQFLRTNMAGGLWYLPRRPSYASVGRPLSGSSTPAPATQHEWPDYLIFFEQLEPTLHSLLRTSSYAECWRTHNTQWHDDWRRHGDVVVWCLDSAEQDAWRAETRRRTEERHEQHFELHFERIVEAIKHEARGSQKRGWNTLPLPHNLHFHWPWSSRPSTLDSWRRSAQALFSPQSSRVWPWTKKSRSAAFLDRFRTPAPTMWDWIPSFTLPEWLGGTPRRDKRLVNRERELWS